MPRDTEFALMPAILRLEQRDEWMTSIDLRGKGKSTRHHNNQQDDELIEHKPSPLIEKFTIALQDCRGPKLQSLALHNHFLDRSELPLVFEALPYLPSLSSLILFHHDLCDDGVELLMQTLQGNKFRKGDVLQQNITATTIPLKELFLSHCNVRSHRHIILIDCFFFTQALTRLFLLDNLHWGIINC